MPEEDSKEITLLKSAQGLAAYLHIITLGLVAIGLYQIFRGIEQLSWCESLLYTGALTLLVWIAAALYTRLRIRKP